MPNVLAPVADALERIQNRDDAIANAHAMSDYEAKMSAEWERAQAEGDFSKKETADNLVVSQFEIRRG